MIRFILTVPDRMKPDVLDQMLKWQTEGEHVTIRIITRPGIVAPAGEPHAESPEGTEEVQTQGPEPVTPIGTGRSHTLYRVIDTATHMGPVPQTVRLYLLDHPNSTAREIQAGTGRGMKSVESAIYALRHKGIVRESEA